MMDHRERFLQIKDFLKPYQRIWQNEIMLMYPRPFEDYSLEWIEELRQYQDKKDVIKLEKKEVNGFVKSPELISFYDEIARLTQLPEAPNYPAMPEDRFTWLIIIPKKQH
jgi:hypothetical protein